MPRAPRPTADQLRRDRALLKRIHLSIDDLFAAGRYVERLRRVRQFRGAPALDGTSREALQLALIVSYARPFSKNKHTDDVQPGIPTFVGRLSAKRRALHDHLIELRHQQLAHSDPKPAELQVRVVEDSAGKKHAVRVRSVPAFRAAISRSALAAIDSLIEFQLRHCKREEARILKLVPGGDQF